MRLLIALLLSVLSANAASIIICEGDSLTAGTGGSAGSNYVSQMALFSTYGAYATNIGHAGDRISTNTTAFDALRNLTNATGYGKKTVVMLMCINDVAVNDSVANITTNLNTWCDNVKAAFPEAKIMGITQFDASLNATLMGRVDTINEWIRTNTTRFDYYADAAADPRLSDHTDTTYFDADGVHLNNAGYAVLATIVRSNLLYHGRIFSDYYVRTDGNDSNLGFTNSASGAWLTIQKAADTAVAGDTIQVQAGTYAEAVSETTSGSSGSPIIFNGNGKVIVGGFSLSGADFVEVRNFTLNGSGVGATTALMVTDATAHNNTFSNIATVGVASWLSGRPGVSSSGTNCYFDYLRITNFGGSAITFLGQGTTITNCIITGQNAWDVFRPFGSNSKIVGCLVTNVSNEPFSGGSLEVGVTYGFSDVSGSPDFSNVGAPSPPYTLSQTFTATGTAPTSWGTAYLHNANHSDIFQVFGDNGAVVTNMLIERNTVIGGNEYQFGNITDDRETNDISGWTFRNNVFVDITRTMNLFAPYFSFLNNTFVRVGPDSSWAIIWGSSGAGRASNTVVLNNIFYECGEASNSGKGWYAGVYLGGIVADYNLVVGTGAGTTKQTAAWTTGPTGDGSYESHGINGSDPLFVSATDFRLQAGSPAIGAGTNLNDYFTTDYDGTTRGSAWDIGAWQFTDSFVPTIVTNNASGARVMGFRGLGMSVLPLPASSLLVDESFEGAGTPAGWTASGTPDFDNTSSPIGGAQDLLFSAGSDRRAYTSFSESGEVWIRLRLKMSAAPSSTPGIVFIQDAVSASAYVSLQVHTSRTLRLIDNSGANTGYTTDAVTAGTDVYVFIHIAKGTGSDAVFDLEWSTTSTRTGSGNKYVSASNGAYAVNSDYIDIYRNDSAWSTSTFQIDDVKVSNTGWPQ